jgi:transcriptional regulator with XRE-family HTH domain
MTAAELIKKRRDDLALTQEGLAQKAGLSVYTISRVETGQTFGAVTKRKLAKALDLKLSDFANCEETK